MKVVKTPKSFPGAFFGVMVGALFLMGLAHSQNSQSEIRKVPWDRSITLLSYNMGRNTTVDFRGTEQMITAKGTSRVKIERGVAQIDARFQDVLLPPIFGPEYTAFVLWAVAPDSSTTNLGEMNSTRPSRWRTRRSRRCMVGCTGCGSIRRGRGRLASWKKRRLRSDSHRTCRRRT